MTMDPNRERYTPFLKESIQNPNEEDITIAHQITMSSSRF